MNESKPSSGWNESKPSFPITMNVDEAMETAAAYLAAHEQEGEPLFEAEEVAITLANEVGRLRAEVEILAVEVTRLQAIEHDQIETQTELAAAKADFAWLRERMKERVEG